MMFYSQSGEDRLLADVFPRRDGVCVEVGANDGRSGSNTLFFEELGWTCVLVEPNPDLAAHMRSFRRGIVCECGASDHEGQATLQLAEGAELAHALSTIGDSAAGKRAEQIHGIRTRPLTIRVRPLDHMLEEAAIGAPIDFMTIDVEGHELPALRGLTLARWRPRVLIVEDNSGGRDREVARYLRSHDYRRFHRTGVNDWYARRGDELLRNAPELRYRAARLGVRWHTARMAAVTSLYSVPPIRAAWHVVRPLVREPK